MSFCATADHAQKLCNNTLPPFWAERWSACFSSFWTLSFKKSGRLEGARPGYDRSNFRFVVWFP
jgi:hypothetical protein